MRKILSTQDINRAMNFVLWQNGRIRQHMESVANKSFEETEMKQTLVINADSMGYALDTDDRPERLIKTVITSFAVYLSHRKVSKADEATALVLQDINGNFKFASIVEYHINESNPDEPGNWSFVMTFNKDDLEDLEKRKTVKKYLVGDDTFRRIIDKCGYDVGGLQFERDTFYHDSCIIVIDTLTQVLDHEAKEGEVVDIEMPGYFTMSVAVENGTKIFSITPDGQLKALIKSDVALDD